MAEIDELRARITELENENTLLQASYEHWRAVAEEQYTKQVRAAYEQAATMKPAQMLAKAAELETIEAGQRALREEIEAKAKGDETV